jgi:hypothetical protein
MTAFARFRGLTIISRNATFAYRGRAIDPRQIGRDLGVDYCLEGSIRKLGQRLRITSQLVRTATGEHVWADRTDCSLAELPDVQDQLGARIVVTIAGRIEASAISAARLKPPSNLDAYDCLWRGLDHHRLGGVTREHAEKAVEWFGKAIEKQPTFGRAHAWHACAIAVRGDV